jgi:hypothetical protein
MVRGIAYRGGLGSESLLDPSAFESAGFPSCLISVECVSEENSYAAAN